MARVLEESFTSVRKGAADVPSGFDKHYDFNVSLSGTFVATMQLEKSIDGGDTYIAVGDASGNPVQFTAPMVSPVHEVQGHVRYRWACTAYTSGTVTAKISF